MTNLDNLASAIVCFIGIAYCTRLAINVPRDRWLSLAAGVVLFINMIAQGAVYFGINRIFGNDFYELAGELLILVAVGFITGRRAHDDRR